ncbi:hypothetical protein O3M35_011583 [Rhynocoris fuscipes]|uniref:Amino acid transporter transmembrane domain-containing protein n=1 Tax=Rhynocoris fuscipes TaxID=488301 RepID=A0AAW1CVN9_9HEMI
MGTNTGNVLTLANSIIGVSVLAMPFCFKQCGIVLSILMLLFSSVISRLACYFLIKSALLEKRKNFEMLAFRVYGPTGKLMVELCIIGFMLGTCVAFFVIMGDLGPAIIGPPLGFDHPSALRPSVLIGVAVFVVLPLGLLRNVDSLNAICAASILFYVCLVLKVLSEAAGNILSWNWVDKVYLWRPSGILQCIPIFSMALSCQTQLFEIFDGLLNTPIDRINSVIRVAINLTTMLYISMGLFGYIAYCNQSFSGNVMMNFSPTIWSEIIKIGFVLSVAVSFPLVIFPCRASIHSLLFSKGSHGYELVGGSSHIPETRFQCITLVIVTCSLVVGLVMPSIEVVLGLVGSTIGVFICVITPAIIFTSLSTKNTNERIVAQMLIGIGLIIMVLGTYANLSATEEVVRENHLADIRSDIKMKAPPPVNPVVVTDLPIKVPEDFKSKLRIAEQQPVVKVKETEEIVKVEGPAILPVAPDTIQKSEKKEIKKLLPDTELFKEPLPVAVKENIPKIIKDNSPPVVNPQPPEEPKEIKEVLPADPIKLSKDLSSKVNEVIKQDTKNILEIVDKKLFPLNDTVAKAKDVKIVDEDLKIQKDVNLKDVKQNLVQDNDKNIEQKEIIKEKVPEKLKNTVEEKKPFDNLTRSMAQGVPLPLAVKGVQPFIEKKSEIKIESIDIPEDKENLPKERELLENIENREKRDTDVEIKREENFIDNKKIIEEKLSENEENIKSITVKPLLENEKLKTTDEDNCPRPTKKTENNDNNDLIKPTESANILQEENLIKSPARLTDPEVKLDTDPKLLSEKQLEGDANTMPKKRDLKSLNHKDEK